MAEYYENRSFRRTYPSHGDGSFVYSSYGSAAPAYEPEREPYFEPEVKPYAEPERRSGHIQTAPQEDPLRGPRSTAVRRNRKNLFTMDLPYLVMLSAAAIAAAFICCRYLRVQSSITAHIKSIEAKEAQLEVIKNANDALEGRINTMINLDQIYQVATQELGMVYAGRSQIIRYDRTESEYVRQYEDIPQ